VVRSLTEMVKEEGGDLKIIQKLETIHNEQNLVLKKNKLNFKSLNFKMPFLNAIFMKNCQPFFKDIYSSFPDFETEKVVPKERSVQFKDHVMVVEEVKIYKPSLSKGKLNSLP
jgi:hypothetical protein